ncbi:hypothetical protein Tco_0724644, partial [Tanacetum coccineum]
TECLVLSPNFKLPDKNHILLKIPRKDNMYSFDMKNIVPKESLTCLVAKATLDESMLWHRLVYVDDILFGSTNKKLCLQVQQKEDGIFISQDKYVAKILKKFNYSNVKSASTPVDLEKPLVKDRDADDVDVHLYRSMIGSLMYLTASRPDIMFVVCACARFQVTPKTSHLLAVKRIFRYLKGKPTLGLWYSRDSPFELVAYTDSDYAGATQDRKSTTGGCQFWEYRISKSWSQVLDMLIPSLSISLYVFANVNAVKRIWAPKLQLFSNSYQLRHCLRGGISQEVGTPRYLSLVVPLTKVGDEAVHKELGDRMERAATTASSFVSGSQDSGSGPRCQDTILGDVNAQTRFEITSIQSIDPPLSRGYTLGSGEDSMKLIGIDEIFPKFAETHNVVAFLEKPKESDGFAEIIDFLKASSVSYALTVNPIQALVDKKRVIVTESSIMRGLHLDDAEGIDCLPTTTIFKELARMGYEKPSQIDQPSTSSQPKKKQKSRRKQRKEAEAAHAETGEEEHFNTPSNDPLPSGEDSMQLNELMVLCTQLQQQVLDLEKAKSDQAIEIASLKKRVDKLEKRRQVLDDDEVFVDVASSEKNDQSIKLDDSTAGEAVTTASVEDSAAPTIQVSTADIGDTQTHIEIKAAKPKVVTTAATTTTTTTRPKGKGVVVHEPSEFRVPQESQPLISKEKGKGIMVKPEVPLKRKDQITLDEQIARDIQAKLDAELEEEQKLARKQEEEANIALIESWENTQAMMEADRLLAERLQSKEREELTDEEKGKLFMELMEKRRKHFAALRAQEKRNRPPTKAQKRTQMSTYLKHMGGYTYKQLKGKSFDEIQKLFDKEMKRVNTFVAMGSEVQESKEKKEEGREETTKGSRKKMLGRKRAGKEQQKESSKKQKVEEEKESEEVDEAELKKLLVIKKDEDIAIDAIPLATKLPVIVDYKLHKEGMLVHYQLIRADGSSKRYSSMIRMLQGIDREDLEVLWRIVKAKHNDTRPEDEFERVLWGDLKVMFEPDTTSDVWRMLQGYRVTIWKLIDSSGVHFVRFDNFHIFMLVEKRYPLTPITITNMLNKKLQTDHQNEMCYQLLKLMVKQQKGL